MSLTADDIASIAHLARIGLGDDELDTLRTELDHVLHLVEQMQAVDTTGVEPLAHPGNAELRLRADEVTEHDQREQLQAPAPDVVDGYFRVPRVIE